MYTVQCSIVVANRRDRYARETRLFNQGKQQGAVVQLPALWPNDTNRNPQKKEKYRHISRRLSAFLHAPRHLIFISFDYFVCELGPASSPYSNTINPTNKARQKTIFVLKCVE